MVCQTNIPTVSGTTYTLVCGFIDASAYNDSQADNNLGYWDNACNSTTTQDSTASFNNGSYNEYLATAGNGATIVMPPYIEFFGGSSQGLISPGASWLSTNSEALASCCALGVTDPNNSPGTGTTGCVAAVYGNNGAQLNNNTAMNVGASGGGVCCAKWFPGCDPAVKVYECGTNLSTSCSGAY